MLADGTITARIHSTIQPDNIGEALKKLRTGGLHGKAVIRF
jgi:D-arabinose 1-dehydrogenase-like Zn-dependent alcohol dehydrogenase